MIFEYSKAPMHYVEGVAAFKAGEWEGKLSCKFGPTRKVIRPKTEGIIFNEKEPLIMPKRRLLSQGTTKEFEFRPCLKMVKQESDSKSKKESIKVIRPSITEGKNRPEKKHYFKYREEHIVEMQDKENDYNNKTTINEEFRNLSKIGFSKKALENLPNNKLLNLNFSKDNSGGFNFFGGTSSNVNTKPHGENKVVLEKAAKSLWQQKQQEQMKNLKMEKDNVKRDMDYVKKLETWEKNFLPKIK